MSSERMPDERPSAIGTCECSHSQELHQLSEYGAWGHGACTIAGCECRKFTWVAWQPGHEPQRYT